MQSSTPSAATHLFQHAVLIRIPLCRPVCNLDGIHTAIQTTHDLEYIPKTSISQLRNDIKVRIEPRLGSGLGGSHFSITIIFVGTLTAKVTSSTTFRYGCLGDDRFTHWGVSSLGASAIISGLGGSGRHWCPWRVWSAHHHGKGHHVRWTNLVTHTVIRMILVTRSILGFLHVQLWRPLLLIINRDIKVCVERLSGRCIVLLGKSSNLVRYGEHGRIAWLSHGSIGRLKLHLSNGGAGKTITSLPLWVSISSKVLVLGRRRGSKGGEPRSVQIRIALLKAMTKQRASLA